MDATLIPAADSLAHIRELLQLTCDSLRVCVVRSSNTPSVMEIVLATIAFLSVLFGPIIQLAISRITNEHQRKAASESIRTQVHIAEEQIKAQSAVAQKQIHAQVVSSNRQDWINKLRVLVSELISESVIYSNEYYNLLKMKEHSNGELPLDPKGKLELTSKFLSKHKQIMRLEREIVLMLNKEEDDHRELESLIRGIVEEFSKMTKQGGECEIGALTDKILTVTRPILKREWERVKKGE